MNLSLSRGRRRPDADHLLLWLSLLLFVTMVMFEPGPVPLQSVEDVLAVRVDELRPRLPERLHDEVDEADLQRRRVHILTQSPIPPHLTASQLTSFRSQPSGDDWWPQPLCDQSRRTRSVQMK